MWFDPNKSRLPSPPAPEERQTGGLNGRGTRPGEGYAFFRTGRPTILDPNVTPLSGRRVSVPDPTPGEAVNARLASLIGKRIMDRPLAEKCRVCFDLDDADRIVGAREDVDPTAPAINRLIVELGTHIARQNSIDPTPAAPDGQTSAQAPKATQQAMRAIIGKTLRPEVAEKYAQAYPGAYDVDGRPMKIFDGTGRVTPAILLAAPGAGEVEEMAAGETTPLTKTNSPHPRDAARIETEIHFELALAARKHELFLPYYEKIRTTWIKGLSEGALSSLLQEGERDYGKLWYSGETYVQFGNELQKANNELARLSQNRKALEAKGLSNLGQYHDNLVARRFETELVKALVEDPPGPVLEASGRFGRRLADYARELEKKAPGLCVRLAARLKDISAPYAHNLPLLRDFLDAPGADAFDLMMRRNENGYDILKQSLVCGQLKNEWRAMTGTSLPFAQKGLDFAEQGVGPARHNRASVAAGVVFLPGSLHELLTSTGKDPDVKNFVSAYLQGVTATQVAVDQFNALVEEISQTIEAGIAVDVAGEIATLRKAVVRAMERERDRVVFSARSSGGVRSAFERNAVDKAARDFRKEVDALIDEFERRCASDLVLTPLRYVPADIREAEFLHPDFPKTPANTLGPGFGTALPHQPKEDPGWGAWRLFPNRENADVAVPSEFEWNAFAANRYIGRGASGSTFSMYNAFNEAAAAGGYNVGDAMLGAIMFMTFDSGHSMSDSMGGLSSYIAYETAGRDIPAGRAALDNFVLDYSAIDMSFLGASAETQRVVAEKIAETFDRTVEWFGNIHEERLAAPPGSQ